MFKNLQLVIVVMIPISLISYITSCTFDQQTEKKKTYVNVNTNILDLYKRMTNTYNCY